MDGPLGQRINQRLTVRQQTAKEPPYGIIFAVDTNTFGKPGNLLGSSAWASD